MRSNVLRSISLSLLLVLVTVCSAVCAAAVEVNGSEVQVGDVVTYEIHASGCAQVIQAVDIAVTYDSDALKYVSGSLDMPNLSGTLVNDSEEGVIRFNALDLDGFSFYEDKIVASMQFTVTSDYAPYLYIKSDIKNFIDAEMTEHTDEFVYYLTLTESELRQIEEGQPSQQTESSVRQEESSGGESLQESGSSQETLSDSDIGAASDLDLGQSVTDSSSAALQNAQTADTAERFNSADSEVKPKVSKPINYSVIFFAAAGMMVIIAVTAIVLLAVMKRSDSENKQ